MKAKLIRLSGTLEIEGTADEIAAVVKALELPTYPSVNIPSVWTQTPVTAGKFSYQPHICRYPENWNATSPAPCLDCGAPPASFGITYTSGSIKTL